MVLINLRQSVWYSCKRFKCNVQGISILYLKTEKKASNVALSLSQQNSSLISDLIMKEVHIFR